MQKSLLTALLVVIFSGIAIGTQSSLTTAAGKITGATFNRIIGQFHRWHHFRVIFTCDLSSRRKGVVLGDQPPHIMADHHFRIAWNWYHRWYCLCASQNWCLSWPVFNYRRPNGSRRCGGYFWINRWRSYSIELVPDWWPCIISTGYLGNFA